MVFCGLSLRTLQLHRSNALVEELEVQIYLQALFKTGSICNPDLLFLALTWSASATYQEAATLQLCDIGFGTSRERGMTTGKRSEETLHGIAETL